MRLKGDIQVGGARDPGGKGVHQVVLVIDPDALLDGKSVTVHEDRDQCDQIGLF